MITPCVRNPRRVWIVGPCGSGKSTLADLLGELLTLPETHLDDIHWNPGWVESDQEDEAARVSAIVAGPEWIIDGNYSRLRRAHHSRVELFIWLDYPLSMTFPRLVKRTFRRAISRELICNGNRENPLETLLSKDSILWWGLSTHNHRRIQLGGDLSDLPCVRFRSSGELGCWLNPLQV